MTDPGQSDTRQLEREHDIEPDALDEELAERPCEHRLWRIADDYGARRCDYCGEVRR